MGRQKIIRNMKVIPEFPNYCATKRGNISSRYTEKWLKPIIHHTGYVFVHLYHNKKRRRYLVHRAVLTVFRGKCPDGMECRHLDGNKLNNNLDNLCWGTKSDNEQDKIRHGTHKCPKLNGEDHPGAKLTEEDVRMIIYSYRTGLFSQREIASWYSISQMAVSDIVTKKKWKHIWAEKEELKI